MVTCAAKMVCVTVMDNMKRSGVGVFLFGFIFLSKSNMKNARSMYTGAVNGSGGVDGSARSNFTGDVDGGSGVVTKQMVVVVNCNIYSGTG